MVQLANATVGSNMLQIFFSHKQSDEELAQMIATRLIPHGGNSLQIFMSSEMPFGEHWHSGITEALRKADWLFLLYTDPDLQWDWCLYEAGFFVGNRQEPKGLFTLLRAGGPPNPLKAWSAVEATESHWHKLLTELFHARGVNPRVETTTLRALAKDIVDLLGNPPERHPFGLEFRLHLSGDQITTARDTRQIPEQALIRIDRGLGELLGKQVSGLIAWNELRDALPFGTQQALGSVAADVITRRSLDCLVIPMVLNRGTAFIGVHRVERRQHAVDIVMQISQCHGASAWTANVFAQACSIQRSCQERPAAAEHVRSQISGAMVSAARDLSPWKEQYPLPREPERTLRLYEIIQSAKDYVFAITVDREKYLTEFWSHPRFRLLYTRSNDMAAARNVRITRVFVVDERTLLGQDTEKCRLIREIVESTHHENIDERLLSLEAVVSYEEREQRRVRSCLVCDDWLTSEAPTAGETGYVAAHDSGVGPLKKMCEWLIAQAVRVTDVAWLNGLRQ